MLEVIQKKTYGICKALLCVPSAVMTFGFVFAVEIKKTCVRYSVVLVFVWHTVGGLMFGTIGWTRWGHSAMWVATCPPTSLRWAKFYDILHHTTTASFESACLYIPC